MSMLASTTSFEIPIGRSSTSNSSEHLTLMGRSRAGDGTAFCIPQLQLLLDCGVPIQKWTPRHVFLSHTHSDHVHYLTHVKSKDTPPLVLLPAKAASFVERYLRAHQEMIDNCMTNVDGQEMSLNDEGDNDAERDTQSYSMDLELRPTFPGEEIALKGVGGGRQYYVRTVECHHRIDTLGFSVFRKAAKPKRVLKEEYIGLPAREIGRLIKEGEVDLFVPSSTESAEQEDEGLFCFLGDTTHKVFEKHPEILSHHSVIIVECSFIDEKDLPRAAQTKHMHWNHLRPFVDAHPEILFVLIHFSLKYSSLELRRFFRNVSSQHRNIHPMLIEQEVQSDWKRSKQEEDITPPVCNCRACCPTANAGAENTHD